MGQNKRMTELVTENLKMQKPIIKVHFLEILSVLYPLLLF